MKTCPRCGETKSLDRFWRDKRTKSGYAVYCIPCGTKRNAEKYRANAVREGRTTRSWRLLSAELPDGRRRCQHCMEALPLDSFVKNAGKAGGIGSYCKPCHISRSTTRTSNVCMAEQRHTTYDGGTASALPTATT